MNSEFFLSLKCVKATKKRKKEEENVTRDSTLNPNPHNIYKSERRPDGQHSLVLGNHRGQRESHTHRSQFQDLTYNLNGFNNITSMKTVAKSLTYFIYIYICMYIFKGRRKP